MSKDLTNASYHSNQDLFTKLGIDSDFPVAGVLNDQIWETRVEGFSQDSAEPGYNFEAEIGDAAAERILPDNPFDRFVARTFEQGSYDPTEPLEWYDGLVRIKEDRDHGYFDISAGDIPYDTVEFLAVPYNSRQTSSSGFNAEDWRVT